MGAISVQGIAGKVPKQKVIPFAKRGDCDDTACFEIGKSNKVQLIHDFATEGWEQRKEFNDFLGMGRICGKMHDRV